MRRRALVPVSLLCLVAMAAPVAATAAVALHGHGHHAPSALAGDPTHGHHHDAETPDHDHEARLATAPAVTTVSPMAAIPVSATVQDELVDVGTSPAPPPRGGPPQLALLATLRL